MSEVYEYVYVWMHPLVCARRRSGLGLGRLCSLRQDLSLNLKLFVWAMPRKSLKFALSLHPRFPVTDTLLTPGLLHRAGTELSPSCSHSAGVWAPSLRLTQCWSLHSEHSTH